MATTSKSSRPKKGTFLVQFWGVRGTLPVPGKDTVLYGGNTNCITLQFKNDFFIFDAGTGIKNLENFLIKKKKLPIKATIFITHPHYDHINGIPFFTPLYMKGNKFDFYGPNHDDKQIKQLISNQMNNIYFPVTIKEFSADIAFHHLTEETFKMGELQISTFVLNHPGRCLGYRVQYKNKIFCYITDNELYCENSPQYKQQDVDKLIDFIHDADLVVMDATYSDERYACKQGWGHSCVSRVIDVADKAHVKLLCLHHHDPEDTDKTIARKVKTAKAILKARHSKTRCMAAKENQSVMI